MENQTEYPVPGAYIEYLGGITVCLHELVPSELCEIGEFTRGNITRWFESHQGPEWVGALPVEDFHAVCGDIEIPWTTETACLKWNTVRRKAQCSTSPSGTIREHSETGLGNL